MFRQTALGCCSLFTIHVFFYFTSFYRQFIAYPAVFLCDCSNVLYYAIFIPTYMRNSFLGQVISDYSLQQGCTSFLLLPTNTAQQCTPSRHIPSKVPVLRNPFFSRD